MKSQTVDAEPHELSARHDDEQEEEGECGADRRPVPVKNCVEDVRVVDGPVGDREDDVDDTVDERIDEVQQAYRDGAYRQFEDGDDCIEDVHVEAGHQKEVCVTTGEDENNHSYGDDRSDRYGDVEQKPIDFKRQRKFDVVDLFRLLVGRSRFVGFDDFLC